MSASQPTREEWERILAEKSHQKALEMAILRHSEAMTTAILTSVSFCLLRPDGTNLSSEEVTKIIEEVEVSQ